MKLKIGAELHNI